MDYKNVKLIKGFTKVIIPFQFDIKEYKIVNGKKTAKELNDFKEKLKLDKFSYKKNDKDRFPFVRSELVPTDMVGGLENMMQDDNDYLSIFKSQDEAFDEKYDSSTIADVYELKSDDRDFFLLERKPNYQYKYIFKENGIEKTVNLSIPTVRIFLFESFAGFLEYEFEFDDNDVDAETFISVNYSLSKINRGNSIFKYDKRVSQDKTEEMTFDIRQLTEKITSEEIMGAIHPIGEYITGEKKDFDYTPQIFTYALFDKKPENLNQLLFNIKKNFKGSFKFPEDNSNLKKNIYQIFDNSYWAYSLNVAANISFLTDNKSTNSFFENDFIVRLKSTYYFLFMCVLNQKYGIIIQKGKLSQFDEYSTDYLTMKGELKKVRKYKTDALKFKYKSFFKTPSNEEHINDYYRQLGVSKNIFELYTSFINDLNDNETVYATLVKKMNDDQDEVTKVFGYERDMFISLIGSIVAICQLLMAKATLLGTGLKWYDILINAILVILPIINMVVNMDSKLEQIYNIVKDKGADKAMQAHTVEEKKKIVKKKVAADFNMNKITQFLIFRKIDKDNRKL